MEEGPAVLESPEARTQPGPTRLLKRTSSRCPVCHGPCPAEVLVEGDSPGRVLLRRVCPQHGVATACIASDARFYWVSQGSPENRSHAYHPRALSLKQPFSNVCYDANGKMAGTLGRNAGGRGKEPFEKLSTCLALIEIVNSCNLACPVCYADSPVGAREQVHAPSLENIQSRVEGVLERKGRIELLQLSGGEPTLHPRFFELLEWIQRNPRIDYVLLNTNGVRLARDDKFAEEFAMAAARGRLQLYLQFDGPQEQGQFALRGADLRATRREAIERCGRLKVPVTLAMTVTRENLGVLWETIEFGLGFRNIRGVSFQPLFQSGRLPAGKGGRGTSGCTEASERINAADIVLSAVSQSGGKLCFEDFTPLPCGDPNCAIIGYLLRIDGQIRSVSEFIDFSRIQGFLRDKVRYRLEDLMQCGCESEPLGQLLKRFELDESNTFRLFIKPFMDAWSWDEDRIDRCCTHVIRPDGKLDSFCRYYSGFSDARAVP